MTDANWSHSRGERDMEVVKRIIAPRKKFAEFNFDCTAKKEHLWNLLTIDQLMVECDKLAEKIREDEPGFEWRSLGKSRNELIRLLEMRTPSHKSIKDDLRPVPECSDRFHADHKKKKD